MGIKVILFEYIFHILHHKQFGNPLLGSKGGSKMDTDKTIKKPIYKKWYLWLIVFIVIAASGLEIDNTTSTDNNVNQPIPTAVEPAESKSNLELLESNVLTNESGTMIVGKIKNNTDKKYNYVQVDISLFDDSGREEGYTSANTDNLESGGTWNFEATVLEYMETYKVKDIIGLN
jgi:hypothetical protein